MAKSGKKASQKSKVNETSSCLVSVLPTVLTFIIYLIAIILCCVFLSRGAIRTRDLLDRQGTYIHMALDAIPEACKIIPIVMVIIGLLALFIATLSSYRNSFCNQKPKRKKCTRVLNILMCLVLVILQVIWIMVTSGLAMPIAMFMGLKMMIKVLEMTRVNLKDFYAMLLVSEKEYHLQGEKLKYLAEEGEVLFKFYLIAFLSALVVCICLTFFIMASVANFTRLRCKRRDTMYTGIDTIQPTTGGNNNFHLRGIEEHGLLPKKGKPK